MSNSWFWYVDGVWPGASEQTSDNLTSTGNGLTIDPATITMISWNDANADGNISDSDSDDGIGADGDSVTVLGFDKTVKEIGKYLNSTMVVNGATYTVAMTVWLFEDDSYGVRIADADIPPGGHFSAVDSLQLGTWDGVDYTASYIATRDQGFVCFAAGTLIETPRGRIRVEDLSPGDLVLTADHGARPLRWTGRRTLPGGGVAAPVRIAAGALGNARDLWVSQQHRMVIAGWRAELLFGCEEVLVAAAFLTNDDSIRIVPCAEVTYVHLLFDRHEIIFAEGIPTEGFHPGSQGIGTMDAATRDELFRLFPELHQVETYGPAARPSLRRWEGRALMA